MYEGTGVRVELACIVLCRVVLCYVMLCCRLFSITSKMLSSSIVTGRESKDEHCGVLCRTWPCFRPECLAAAGLPVVFSFFFIHHGEYL